MVGGIALVGGHDRGVRFGVFGFIYSSSSEIYNPSS